MPRAVQENKRCHYILEDVEIDIDSWPMIPDYIEIEGKMKRRFIRLLIG